MSLFDYIDAHPVYTFFLGIYLLIIVSMAVGLLRFLINRPLRHVSIWLRGWPPPHIDADGDHKPEPEKKVEHHPV